MKIECIKDWNLTPDEILFKRGEMYKITKQTSKESTGIVSYEITSGDRSIWFHSDSEYFQIPNIKVKNENI